MTQERRRGSPSHPDNRKRFPPQGSLQSTPTSIPGERDYSTGPVLESPRNPLIQDIRAATRGGTAMLNGLVVIEGPHLLEEALNSEWRVEHVLVASSGVARWAGLTGRLTNGSGCPVTIASDRAFEAAADTQHSQGILGLARPRPWTWPDVTGGGRLVLVLDSIRDPGNAGTILRSAEAFGASGVVALEASVQFTNGKLLRAAAGSLFRLPYITQVSAADMVRKLRASGFTLYGLTALGPRTLFDADFQQPCALVVGNEGAGLSAEVMAAVEPVVIPSHRVESLNAAVACSIALFEASRQRSGNAEASRQRSGNADASRQRSGAVDASRQRTRREER